MAKLKAIVQVECPHCNKMIDVLEIFDGLAAACFPDPLEYEARMEARKKKVKE